MLRYDDTSSVPIFANGAAYAAFSMAVESIAAQEDPGSSLSVDESGERYAFDKYGNRIRVDVGRYLDDYGNPLIAWGWGDPLPQGVVDFAAGFGDTLSFGGTAVFREFWDGNRVVDFGSGEYYGGVALHFIGFRRGAELSIGRNFRLAPWGNCTGHATGRYPHYHRRVVDPKTGQTVPGGLLSVIGLGTEDRAINQSGTASDERLGNC